jgi:hypothetical protein
MPLFPQLLGVGAAGPPDVEVIFHPALYGKDVGGRKALARHCHEVIREGLLEALTGRRQQKVPEPGEMI